MVVANKGWVDHEADDPNANRTKGLIMSEQLVEQMTTQSNQITTSSQVDNEDNTIATATTTTTTTTTTTSTENPITNDFETKILDDIQPEKPDESSDDTQENANEPSKCYDFLSEQTSSEGTPEPTPLSSPQITPLSTPQQTLQQPLKQTPQVPLQTKSTTSTSVQTKNGQNNEIKPGVRVFMICQPNSHPFQTRNILLEPNQEVKVGRSITRNRVSENNACFDCKVLSRNHAILWMSDGKFYIRDTGSSNGTFVNSQRLSLTAALSKPFQVKTGDIVQFGVDVVENSRKETHGCIVVLLKFSTDSDEAKGILNNCADEDMGNNKLIHVVNRSLPAAELYRLNSYVQEAVQHEQMLETKLINLQKVVELTRKNSMNTWQAMIEEDLLLSRIDILENKLQYFQKNVTDDELRKEILKLQDDKSAYQNCAKEALRKVHQERVEAKQKLSTIERALCSSEEECGLLRDQLFKTQQNFQEVTVMLTTMEENNTQLQQAISATLKQQQMTEAQLRKLTNELNKRCLEYAEVKSVCDNVTKERNDLMERIEIYEKFNDHSSEEGLQNKGYDEASVANWLKNPFNPLEHSIFSAICKNNEEGHISAPTAAPQPTQPPNATNNHTETNIKLIGIEKNLSFLEELLTKLNSNGTISSSSSTITTSTSSPDENHQPSGTVAASPIVVDTISDGNQNNQHFIVDKNGDDRNTDDHMIIEEQPINQQHQVVKGTIVQLRDLYTELRTHLLANGGNLALVPKEKFDDIHAQLLFCQSELKWFQAEAQARPDPKIFQEQLKECERLRQDVKTLTEQIKKLPPPSLPPPAKHTQTNRYTPTKSTIERRRTPPSSGSSEHNDSLDEIEESNSDLSVKTVAQLGSEDASTSCESIDSIAISTEEPMDSLNDSSSLMTTVVKANHINANSVRPAANSRESSPKAIVENNTSSTAAVPQENFATFLDDTSGSGWMAVAADDIQMLSDPDVQREEELIAFKEECLRLMERNAEMKNQINELQIKLSHGTKMITTIMYAAPIIVIIGYLLIAPYL